MSQKRVKSKSLKNLTMPSPKSSSYMRTSFKRTENQMEQVAPEKEGNVPSNDVKSDLIVID